MLGLVKMIKLENIHKVYQLDKNHSLHALKGINLTINKGESLV